MLGNLIDCHDHYSPLFQADSESQLQDVFLLVILVQIHVWQTSLKEKVTTGRGNEEKKRGREERLNDKYNEEALIGPSHR